VPCNGICEVKGIQVVVWERGLIFLSARAGCFQSTLPSSRHLPIMSDNGLELENIEPGKDSPQTVPKIPTPSTGNPAGGAVHELDNHDGEDVHPERAPLIDSS
jgi:hypothetical protein